MGITRRWERERNRGRWRDEGGMRTARRGTPERSPSQRTRTRRRSARGLGAAANGSPRTEALVSWGPWGRSRGFRHAAGRLAVGIRTRQREAGPRRGRLSALCPAAATCGHRRASLSACRRGIAAGGSANGSAACTRSPESGGRGVWPFPRPSATWPGVWRRRGCGYRRSTSARPPAAAGHARRDCSWGTSG